MAVKTGLTEQEMLQYLLTTYPAARIANVAHYSRVSCTTLRRILAGERVSRRTWGKLHRLYQERVPC